MKKITLDNLINSNKSDEQILTIIKNMREKNDTERKLNDLRHQIGTLFIKYVSLVTGFIFSPEQKKDLINAVAEGIAEGDEYLEQLMTKIMKIDQKQKESDLIDNMNKGAYAASKGLDALYDFLETLK